MADLVRFSYNGPYCNVSTYSAGYSKTVRNIALPVNINTYETKTMDLNNQTETKSIQKSVPKIEDSLI